MTQDPNQVQMDMDAFDRAQAEAASNAGGEFADVPRIVVTHGQLIRLIGSFKKAWEHFINMPSGPRPYLCGGPETDCPICAVAARYATSEDPGHQKLSKNIRAREKYYFNVLDRSPTGKVAHANSKACSILTQNQKGNSIGTQLFRAFGGVVAMRKQMGQNKDPNTFDMMLTKEGSGVSTKYGAQFTGAADPLTPEELAYKRWPLEEIARLNKQNELQAAADAIQSGAVVVQSTGDDEPVTATKPTASGPVARAKPLAPPPAVAPRAQQPAQRVAAPAPQMPSVAPPKLQIRPAQKMDEFQSTAPRALNESDDVQTNCEQCGVEMIISMSDTRDLKCHGCGKVYQHPSKS